MLILCITLSFTLCATVKTFKKPSIYGGLHALGRRMSFSVCMLCLGWWGGGHVSCFRLWFIAVPGNAAPGPGRACPNAFQRAHQPWLNTCYGVRTKRANPICISDILNIVQSPGITRSFSARWNPKTYFSNLWTDDKSKLSRGQWNIHQRAENTLWALRCGLERAHRCGVYELVGCLFFLKHQYTFR